MQRPLWGRSFFVLLLSPYRSPKVERMPNEPARPAVVHADGFVSPTIVESLQRIKRVARQYDNPEIRSR